MARPFLAARPDCSFLRHGQRRRNRNAASEHAGMSADNLKSPWWVAGGSTIGLIVGNGAIVLFTYGILVGPIVMEFGWTRGIVGTANFFAHVTAAAATPFVGMLIDRYGIRRTSLSFITLFSLSVAAIGLTPASPIMFFLLYALCGLFSAGQTPMPYAKAVSACFDANRGLALGIAMTGVGIGTSLIPRWTQFLVDSYGWREAYFGLGLTTFVIAFPAVALFVGQADGRLSRGSGANAASIPGITARDALASKHFWTIGIASIMFATAVLGTIGHLVPLMVDHGMDRQTAASMMFVVGMSTIIGRLVSGYLLDRFFAPYVAAMFFGLPLLSISLLAGGVSDLAFFFINIGLGLGLGAEIDLMGFLVSRYFGLRAYGQIYGFIFALFAIGSGTGPMLLGFGYDFFGSYNVTHMISIALVFLSTTLLWRLGPYTFPAPHASAAASGRQAMN
nr:MAG: MFS transporter [Hyphomicrobiales bacterium]